MDFEANMTALNTAIPLFTNTGATMVEYQESQERFLHQVVMACAERMSTAVFTEAIETAKRRMKA